MLKKFFGFLMVTTMLASLLSACGASTASSDARKLLTDLTANARLTVNQPGWVHVVENIVYDTDNQDRGKLSTGQTIPLVQAIDIWYHINDSKRVYQYVWTMSSQDGQTVETIVFRNNLAYNLTTNISEALNPYPLSLDFQFADELDNFISNSKNHPVVTTAEINGKSTTVFTLNEQLDTPRTATDFTQPITAAGSIAYFDAESGFLLRLLRTVVLADGSKRTYYTDDITIEPGVQPPQDIQNYVNGIF
jgi:hypothetical protein